MTALVSWLMLLTFAATIAAAIRAHVRSPRIVEEFRVHVTATSTRFGWCMDGHCGNCPGTTTTGLRCGHDCHGGAL